MGMLLPHMRPEEYKTYQILAPIATHFRPATCADLECQAYLHGWTTTVDRASDIGEAQFEYITKRSGRRFTMERQGPEGNMVVFTFEAGQTCFKGTNHKTRIDKQEIFVVRQGDYRRRDLPHRRFTGARAAEDWRDDFMTHQQSLADILERG